MQGIASLVPHRVRAALRLYLATRPRAPFERPGIALKKCFLRPLSVIPAVLWNTGFSVPSWHFHNIFGMLQSLVSLFINCQIVIASPGLRLKRKIEL